jgi:hypothetical protein
VVALAKNIKVKIKLKIVALRRGCYEATISPVSWSTQPISGQVSYQKSVNLMSFSLVISLGNMSLTAVFLLYFSI